MIITRRIGVNWVGTEELTSEVVHDMGIHSQIA